MQKNTACWHCANYSAVWKCVMVHRRVLQPVLLATTVFCVSAALMMVLFGVATAGRAPGSCSMNEQVTRAVCELPAAYWFGCALCLGKDGDT